VQKSFGNLDEMMGSPTSIAHSETIRALENRIEEMSITQQRITRENTGLKHTVDASEKAMRENESLRIANSQFQLEYERLVEELKDRDNDEIRYNTQVKIVIYNGN